MDEAIARLRYLRDETESVVNTHHNETETIINNNPTLTSEEIRRMCMEMKKTRPSSDESDQDVPQINIVPPPQVTPLDDARHNMSDSDTLTPEALDELRQLIKSAKEASVGNVDDSSRIIVPDDAILGSQEVRDVDITDLPIPGSPPDLHYPTTLELMEDEKAAKLPDFSINNLPDQTTDAAGEIEASPDQKLPDVATVLRDTAAALGAELEKLEIAEEMEMMEALAEVGLLQIVYDMSKEKESGRTLDKNHWVQKIVKELKEREEGLACFSVRKVSNEEDEMDTDGFLPPLEFVSSTPQTSPDDKPAPLPIEPPDSPTNWYPDVDVPPYVPTSPAFGNHEPLYVPKSPEPDPMDEVRLRVSMLEDRVEASHHDLKGKLKEIETQMFADECLLTELKWENEGARHTGNRGRSERKRTHRRRPQDLPAHRYPTRYSNAMGGSEKVVDLRRDVGKMGDRIRRVEDRIDTARQEIKKLADKISAGLALDAKIDELKDQIASQQEAQANINRVLHSELADLKNSLGPAIATHTKRHVADISTLQQQIQYLYGYAASQFSQSQKTYVKSSPSVPYPTPVSSPNQQLVTAF